MDAKTSSLTNSQGLKRAIPEPVKRAVRQRCKFGCVVCGNAVYEYHHFDPPFAEAKEHNPSGITLLCGTCHGKVTRKTLSDGTVRLRNDQPFSASVVRDLLDVRSPVRVIVGNVMFWGDGPIIQIDSTTLFDVETVDGETFVSACVYDEKGTLAIEIKRNELLISKEYWDVTFIGPVLTIRNELRKAVLECRFFPPHGLYVSNLSFFYKNMNLVINSGRLEVLQSGKVMSSTRIITFTRGRLRVNDTGGVVLGPGFAGTSFPENYFLKKVKSGEFDRLQKEVFSEHLHLFVDDENQSWRIENGRNHLVFSADSRERLFVEAQLLMREDQYDLGYVVVRSPGCQNEYCYRED